MQSEDAKRLQLERLGVSVAIIAATAAFAWFVLLPAIAPLVLWWLRRIGGEL